MKYKKIFFILFLTFSFGISLAEEKPTIQSKEKNKLPNVLLIGDSVYQAFIHNAIKMLKGRANLHYSPTLTYHTGQALDQYNALIGSKKWDLIHFNFGFNDIMYKDPTIKSIRAMHKDAGGVPVTSLENYEKNLQELVKRFKKNGAKVIWASTTPIYGSNGILYEGDEITYNNIAAKVMRENNITINDMHTHAKKYNESNRHKGTFSYKGATLHTPIIRSVLKELKLYKPIKGPLKVFIMLGGKTHMGSGVVGGGSAPRAGSKPGSLDNLVLNKKTAVKFKHLLNDKGNWKSRSDVWLRYDRRWTNAGLHGIRYAGDRQRNVGYEYSLGITLGDHYKEQVFIYKSSLGSPSVCPGFITVPKNQNIKFGKSYNSFIKVADSTLEQLSNTFPVYDDSTGYELAGLIINLGEHDKDISLFANTFPHLIKALRKHFKQPKLPIVIVGSGLGGREKPQYPELIKAQQAIAERPEFKGNVIFTDTRDFWPDPKKSPDPYPTNWYGNALSYYQMGEAIGKDLISLQKN